MKANRERLYKDVEMLASIQPPRNYINMESLDRVSAYIHCELAAIGMKPKYQEFDVDGRQYRNVIASYNTAKKERLIIGAHYDVCGDQPGADDNASGVAGLLETARMMKEHAPGSITGLISLLTVSRSRLILLPRIWEAQCMQSFFTAGT